MLSFVFNFNAFSKRNTIFTPVKGSEQGIYTYSVLVTPIVRCSNLNLRRSMRPFCGFCCLSSLPSRPSQACTAHPPIDCCSSTGVTIIYSPLTLIKALSPEVLIVPSTLTQLPFCLVVRSLATSYLHLHHLRLLCSATTHLSTQHQSQPCNQSINRASCYICRQRD